VALGLFAGVEPDLVLARLAQRCASAVLPSVARSISPS